MSDEIEETPEVMPEPENLDWDLADFPNMPKARGRMDIGLDIMLHEFASDEGATVFQKRWARRIIEDAGIRARAVTAACKLARGHAVFQDAAAEQLDPTDIAMSAYVAVLRELLHIWEVTEPPTVPKGIVR